MDETGGAPELLDEMLVAVTEQHVRVEDIHADNYHFCDEWECDWSYGLRALRPEHKTAIAKLIRSAHPSSSSAGDGVAVTAPSPALPPSMS